MMRVGRADVLVVTGSLVVLAGCLLLATSGAVGAIVACVGLVGLVALLVLGLERVTVATLVAAFATAPMYRGLEGLTGGHSTPTDLLLALAAALLVPVVITRRLELPTAYVVGLLMVALFGLVACAFADQPIGSLFGLIRLLFFLGMMPILIAWWRPHPKTVSLLLWSYVAGHVASTLDALAEGPVVGNRYQGLTHHTNAFGMAGLTSIAILLYLVARHRSTVARLAAGSAGALSVLSVVLSGSRAALAVAVVLVLLVPIVERTAVTSVILVMGVIAGAVALPLLLQSGDGGSALTRLAGDPTATVADSARTNALDLGLQRYWESPVFGNGLADVEYFHNVFLEVAIGAGLGGLVGYLLVLYALVRPLLSQHVFRRLSYLPLAFVGMGPALPGIWDETMWVPISLSVLAAIGIATRVDDPETVTPDVTDGTRPRALTRASRPVRA